MFAKKHRLGSTKNIQLTFRRGRNFFNSFFIVRFLPRPETASRFAVIVSTKVDKSAVKRNRLKRLLRETIKKRMDVLPKGDYAVVVKPAAGKLPEAQALTSFKELMEKRVLGGKH